MVRRVCSWWVMDALTDMSRASYPETNRLSLEEIDYLFIKEGNKGSKKLLAKAGPVVESLKPREQIERDLEREVGSDEVKGVVGALPAVGGTEHRERGEDDEKSSHKDME